MTTIRVAIIVDPAGSYIMDVTPADEIKDHVEYYSALLAPLKLKIETPEFGLPEHLDADLVIFDFGGMGMGNDLLGDNSRRLIRWLQDHPSSLVIVASSFSYLYGVLPELRELGLFIPGKDDGPDVYEREQVTPVHNLIEQNKYSAEWEAQVKTWCQQFTPKVSPKISRRSAASARRSGSSNRRGRSSTR